MSDDRLRLVCTDRGTHPVRALALVMWTPGMVDGLAIWDATEDQSKHTPETIAETVRATNAGPNKVTKRHAVETVTRVDGGLTFILHCQTCGPKSEIRLRDDTLSKVLRGLADTPTHGPTFDVSLFQR
jgi:hypothetical protein